MNDEPKPPEPAADPLAAEAAALIEKVAAQKAEGQAAQEAAKAAQEAAEKGAILAHLPALHAMGETVLNDPARALALLAEKGTLDVTPTGAFIVAADGTREPLTADSLRAAAEDKLSPLFVRAQGYSGAGGRQPREAGGSAGVDLSRIGDRKYWKENKGKLTAALKATKGGA